MPKKPNYNFEKRQREMAKQKKAEEKALRKAQGAAKPQDEAGEEVATEPEDTTPPADA
ncbi:MAG TPA: hypothetical protein VFT46_07425 [Holophagaceae bacterium]|nr:hypothetical protein [Holophagaceae bacterium]